MKTVSTGDIMADIREMCVEANHYLSDDMACVFERTMEEEQSPLGRQVLGQSEENLAIIEEDMISICRDTRTAIVFMKVGRGVHIEGGSLSEAIREEVCQGYREGYLRKSVVRDLIDRVNTSDNTPAAIHYEIMEGDQVGITVVPKGFGSENVSYVFVLKPVDGLGDMKEATLTAVKDTSPNVYPPTVVGVGIDEALEKYVVMAKHVLTRNLEEKPSVPYVREPEGGNVGKD